MKKIFLASLILTSFSLSILLVQISCSKNTDAQPPNNTAGITQLNKIVYETASNGGPRYNTTIWIVNYDGTNQTRVNIILPSGLGVAGNARLSPDGKTIFFVAGNNSTYKWYIYSCNIDGSNAHEIVDGSALPNEGLNLDGAY